MLNPLGRQHKLIYLGIYQYFVSALKKNSEGKYENNGGRVMIVIGTGDNIEEAQKNAYEQIKHIKSEQLFYRNDIGHKALKEIN